MAKPSRYMEKLTPLILIAPSLAYLLFFISYPLFHTFHLVFTSKNIGYLLTSPSSNFIPALVNTLLLVAVIVPIQVAVALGLAMLFSMKFPGKSIALYFVILPFVISDVAAGLIWYSMLSANGFLNRLLINMGLIESPIHFFGYQYRSMEFLAIVLAEVWRATSLVFIIVFAGLQMISVEHIEAAEIFGANALQRLRYIIIPMLKPSLQAALIIRTLWAFQVFGVVWILAGRDIPVLAGEAYYEQVELKHPDIAAFYALVIALISIAISYVYIKLLRAKYLEEAG